jgi:hypothetical protein
MSAAAGLSLALAPLSEACEESRPETGIEGLLDALAERLPGPRFHCVLSRGGWHRIGGLVDPRGRRVADRIGAWVEEEAPWGEVEPLLERYIEAGLLVTRWQGTTHYLTAPCGPAATDFVQLEIEGLQEVAHRALIDPDDPPEDLAELLDPADARCVEPMPVGDPRYALRRMLRVPDWVAEHGPARGSDAGLARFFADWEASSAGQGTRLCVHWALALRQSAGRTGKTRLTARPVPAGFAHASLRGAEAVADHDGAARARAVQAFDRAAGYPFAWFFHMVATTEVPFALGESVLADLAAGYRYLPERDAAVLRAWSTAPYAA